MSVRRLAAIDMYGTKGEAAQASPRTGGARGGSTRPPFPLRHPDTAGRLRRPYDHRDLDRPDGSELRALAIYAIDFSRGSDLVEELKAVDTRQELRYYSVAQLWVLVPLLFVLLALRESLARR